MPSPFFYFLPKAILGNICSILDKILVNGGLKLAATQFFLFGLKSWDYKIIQFMQKSQIYCMLLFTKKMFNAMSCTMCDFHNFGLIFAGQMHCLPQRLKSTLFEIFSNGGCLKGTWSVEKISNNVDFSLWGNRATTWEYFLAFSSETKIMKIRHSA